MTELNDISNLIKELNTTNSSNEKKEILKKYPQCKTLLEYVYSPYKKFNITSTNLKKRNDLIDYNAQQKNIINILDELNNREKTGHNAIALVNGLIEGNKEYADLIYKIIDKNLEVRLDSKSINKIWPGTIPEFEVALANKYEDFKSKINFTTDKWLASRKLDGVRCITRVENGTVTFFSRKGHEFLTLNNLREEILEKFPQMNFVLDGEICLTDENGNENFQDIMKEIRRKDHTIENPMYMVFDFLTLEEFDSGKSKSNLLKRYDDLFENYHDSCFKHIRLVSQIRVTSEKHLIDLSTNAVKEGWEGLILRKDAHYKGKRSNDLLKVKKFHDAEYEVVGIETGLIRYIKDGVDTSEEMLSGVNILHKGNTVGVGSGFSMEQRKDFFSNPEKIIGKIITVNYFEETKDQHGNFSLRFPTVKYIHGEKREI
jgi:DNA ligase-1